MFTHLALTRPLAVIDLETTGIDTRTARIVEISVIKLDPSGTREQKTRRLNPGISIPSDATEIHGIRDADVAGEPSFSKVAATLRTFLDGCDLCGYNLKHFDLKVLYAEFQRAGISFELEGRAIIDPMEIFYRLAPRHLSAAVQCYLDREHESAHAAATDALATLDVLDAMLARHPELPRTPSGLHEEFRDPNSVDSSGFFTRVDDEIRFNKGKYRGQPLNEIALNYPDYLRWMLTQDFFEDTKAVVAHALNSTTDA